MSWGYYGWRPYVPVARRRANAARELAKLSRKSGSPVSPVVVEGRTIARTFWGQAWCDNLEAYSDFANRLPRGRAYVRNGSVVDLQIAPGQVTARVAGSELYRIEIKIKPLAAARWKSIQAECAGKIDSLMELLQGRLSSAVMAIVTQPERGLFPAPREIEMGCSCPDWAGLCKHVAASLYGVGARLDQKPELLFLLRGVEAADLISRASAREAVRQSTRADGAPAMSEAEMADVFGIEVAAPSPTPTPVPVDAREPTPAPARVDAPARKITTKSVPSPQPQRRKRPVRIFTPAARARLAAAVRLRWAKIKEQASRRRKTVPSRPRPMSQAAKARMAAAMRARWAAGKAAGRRSEP